MDQSVTSTVDQIANGVVRLPPPAWADVVPVIRPAKPNPHFIAGGVCALLDDTQVDLTGPARAWFSHRADLVTAGVGAERVARFEAVYDPTYERIEIHFIRVLRGDQVIDHTQSQGFEVLRRERNLEQLKFDGRLSVHLTIPDVRVGDIVEVSYTQYGQRPLLGDKHAAWIGFEWRDGIVEVRHRLRHPVSRPVAIRSVNNPPEPTVTEADGIIDKRWRATDCDSHKGEPLAPPWVLQRAELQFSEWRDWAEVAATFAPGYIEEAQLAPEVEAEIARIAALPTQSEQAAAVLHFVQQSIRYLAMAIGDGGFVPRPLAEIWATRYGDCKDKAKLYVAMARRLGLDACATLVNTREGAALNEWIPSALAFDHCIVNVRVDGKGYWVDPTCLPQPSALDRVSQSRYGYALPLRDGTDAVEWMGDEPHLHSLEVNEWIQLGDGPDTPVRYEWRVTMRGWRAEDQRARFAREGVVGLFKMYAEDIQRTWPKARPVKQDVMHDNEAANEVATIEDYDIADAWTKQPNGRYAFDTFDLYLRTLLPKLDQGPRTYPIYLGHVGRITRKIEIQSVIPWSFGTWAKRIDASSISYGSELRTLAPNRAELVQEVDIRSWTLPAEEAQQYRDIIAQLELSDLRLENRLNGRGKFAREGKDALDSGWWFWARVVIGLVVIGSIAYRALGPSLNLPPLP